MPVKLGNSQVRLVPSLRRVTSAYSKVQSSLDAVWNQALLFVTKSKAVAAMVSPRQGILVVVSTAGAGQGYEVVVAGDGSIPAERLAALGVRPGSHLRTILAEPPAAASGFRGSLKGFPEPSWEDFEHASEVARSDFELS
ncbi:MAG: hypothetical protein M0008_01730 [Actinomycetota bacterium]|nr:hypothetical protein [Actinomycetota bacterium]